MKPELRLDFCSYEAARFACRRWHYSKKIPVGKLVKIGAWEDGRFVGVIVFGDGLLGPKETVYGGISKFSTAEIVRVALREHEHEVSRMISIAIRLLRKRCPGIELIVAFADTGQNHIGTIYQASGFVYTGLSAKGRMFRHRDGRILHNRAVSANGYRSHFGHIRKVPRTDECTIIESTEKHRYLLPLTPEMKMMVEKLKKPSPKRASGVDSDTLTAQVREGGASPTGALHL